MAQLLDPVLGEELEDVVADEHAARQALDADLPMNVLRDVSDDALLTVAEFCRRLLRASFFSFFAWFLEAESHFFRLSLRATGA
jgi:hypothetical protein